MQKGKALIFCAPSGAGKTTIVRHLLANILNLKFSISATTRLPRKGIEVHGRDYYFLDVPTFRSYIKEGKFYEWEEVYKGCYYGTLKAEVERLWAEGFHVVFDVDVQGGINLKKELADRAFSVFVNAESIDVLRQRLEARNTESSETIEKRMQKAELEMNFANKFDYVLVNRNLEDALSEAENIVHSFLQK